MRTDLNTELTSSDAYVYVLIREDIPTEQQLVQVGHAAWEMALRLGSKGLAPREVCNLVVAKVANRAALQATSQRLWEADIDHELFYEPDREMGHSALCTRPVRSRAEREMFKRYPLWREPMRMEPCAGTHGAEKIDTRNRRVCQLMSVGLVPF